MELPACSSLSRETDGSGALTACTSAAVVVARLLGWCQSIQDALEERTGEKRARERERERERMTEWNACNLLLPSMKTLPFPTRTEHGDRSVRLAVASLPVAIQRIRLSRINRVFVARKLNATANRTIHRFPRLTIQRER